MAEDELRPVMLDFDMQVFACEPHGRRGRHRAHAAGLGRFDLGGVERGGETVDTRSAIVAAFEQLVAASSYEGVTVERICQTANVSRRTFYRHFDDKRAVLEAVLEADLIKPVHDIHELIDSDNLKSSSTIIYGRALRKVCEKRLFYEKVFTTRHPELMDVYIGKVVQINREAKGVSDLPPIEAEFASYVIAAAGTYAMAKWLSEGCATPVEEQTRLCLRWIYGRFRELDEQAGRWEEKR